MQQNYDWPRFWYPRDKEPLWAENGLLSPMAIEPNSWDPNSSLFQLSELSDTPCLILLGEPGSGKSHCLKEIVQNSGNDRHYYFNLSDYTTGMELEREVFENNPAFAEWRTGGESLYLFLDSLDEGIVRNNSITRWLQRIIDKYRSGLDRLRIRIACRTTDWPIDFENYLKRTWGENDVRVFVLAPLRQQDIVVAAEQNGLIADRFWNEVVQKGVEVFASRPITLNFLIAESRRLAGLPATKCELYEQGCLGLCKDISTSHRKDFRTQTEERFLVAARLAAFTIFAARIGVAKDSQPTGNGRLLAVQDCTSSGFAQDDIGGRKVDVSDSTIRETLQTALFRGGEIRQWVHETLPEFLAAWYVVRKLVLPQIKNLVFQQGQLIPQLEETAAWIASFNKAIFDEILRSDPQVLLRNDVAGNNSESRDKLTLSLLEKCQANGHFPHQRSHLSRLKHPGLANSLRNYLRNPARNEDVRQFAIDVAVECRETSLLDDLIGIALDDEESPHLRMLAANGILGIGDQVSKSQLKPLAVLPLDNRYHADLKRLGILATWPHSLSAKELFETLVVPSHEIVLIDYYAYENWRDVILPHLKHIDLPFALSWIRDLGIYDHELLSTFADLRDAIFLIAWNNLEQPGVVDAFAEVTLALWQQHRNVLERSRNFQADETKRLTENSVYSEDNKRQLLLRKLISLAARFQDIAFQFRHDVPLLGYSDTAWLVERFAQCENPEEKSLIAKLIRIVIDLSDPQQFHYIYQVGQEDADLWQTLGFHLFTQLDSEEAHKARERHLQQLEHKRYGQEVKQRSTHHPLCPTPIERVRNELERFNEGDNDAWWRMNQWIMLSPDGSSNPLHNWEYDFSNLPVWSELNGEEKARIVASSASYVATYKPDDGICVRWWEKRSWIFWPIVAGCRAFFALETFGKIDQIAEADWRKWAPALTYYVYLSVPYASEELTQSRKKAFLSLLKSRSPEEVTETIIWIAECEDEAGQFFLASWIDELWDDHLAQALVKSIHQEKVLLANAAQLLSSIAAFNFTLAEPILKDWLLAPVSIGSTIREEALVAGQMFLQHAPDAGWPLLWPLIQKNAEFGTQVVRSVAKLERFGSKLARRLTVTNLADFYLWLLQHYPPENDPPTSGVFSVTPEHEIAGFRGSLLYDLVERGSKESILQLRRIENSQGIDLSNAIKRSESILRHNIWQPLSPEELRVLFQNKSSRWIQDESQLLDVLVEVLDQLNRELQGQNGATPSVIDLWNEYPHGRSRSPRRTPKDEERLSDYIERYLKRELQGRSVFVGRETQIARGNLTDILIEAKLIGDGEELVTSLAIVIEVKGCWHSELRTALRKQLVDRYLRPHARQHGIYLVGRFYCEEWSKEDDENRWSASHKVDEAAMRLELERQAQEFVQEGFDIRVHFLDAKLSV